MRIFVTAKPSAKETLLQRIDDTHFRIAVREPPIQGRANAAIMKELADHLEVSSSRITLISGFSSKQKVFEIS